MSLSVLPWCKSGQRPYYLQVYLRVLLEISCASWHWISELCLPVAHLVNANVIRPTRCTLLFEIPHYKQKKSKTIARAKPCKLIRWAVVTSGQHSVLAILLSYNIFYVLWTTSCLKWCQTFDSPLPPGIVEVFKPTLGLSVKCSELRMWSCW